MVALKRERIMVSHGNNFCSGVVNHVLLNTFGVERGGLWLHRVIFLERVMVALKRAHSCSHSRA